MKHIKNVDEFINEQSKSDKNITVLPKSWVVKMYPEVKRWIWNVLDLCVYQSVPEDFYWFTPYSELIGKSIPKRGNTFSKNRYDDYVNGDTVELSRKQFITLVLKEDYNDIIRKNEIEKERNSDKPDIFREYTNRNFRDPYGYNFLKSRRP